MRQLKFRVWSKNENQFLNETFGIQSDGSRIFRSDGFEWERNDAKDFVIQQYTGLKDVNGVEIYEGDRLKLGRKDNTTICTVSYKDGCFGAELDKDWCNKNQYWWSFQPFCNIQFSVRDGKLLNGEVVGNIYER